MRIFQAFLIVMIVSLAAYTGIVGVHHGWNIFPLFFGDILAMNWPGQFNFDFTCLLLFSGLWLMWRHHFSCGGIILGLIGFVGGTMLLAPYLLYASIQAKGDVRELLLGKKRASK